MGFRPFRAASAATLATSTMPGTTATGGVLRPVAAMLGPGTCSTSVQSSSGTTTIPETDSRLGVLGMPTSVPFKAARIGCGQLRATATVMTDLLAHAGGSTGANTARSWPWSERLHGSGCDTTMPGQHDILIRAVCQYDRVGRQVQRSERSRPAYVE